MITSGTLKAVATGIYFIIYGQLEGNVLGPFVFRRTVHLDPLVTLQVLGYQGEPYLRVSRAGVFEKAQAAHADSFTGCIAPKRASPSREARCSTASTRAASPT